MAQETFVAEHEAPFVGVALESGAFRATVHDERDLRAALNAVDPRWRLDIVMAVDDLTER